MKSKINKDRKAIASDHSKEPENNISYVVRKKIIRYDDARNSDTADYQVVRFNGDRAIESRKEAFEYALQLIEDSYFDGRLYYGHIDSHIEQYEKQMKDVFCLWVLVDCENDETGEQVTISDGDFRKSSYDFKMFRRMELEWYNHFGYDTDGLIISVTDLDDNTYDILDYRMWDNEDDFAKLLRSLQRNESSNTNHSIKDKDGNIIYLPIIEYDYRTELYHKCLIKAMIAKSKLEHLTKTK